LKELSYFIEALKHLTQECRPYSFYVYWNYSSRYKKE